MKKIANLITAVKAKTDLVALISKSVALSAKGNNYWGLCPFHNDKNPSLSVSSSRQIFKCFSCGVGGDCIKFMELNNKISFRQALQNLAVAAGIENNLSSDLPQFSEQQLRIFAINDTLHQYCLNLLHTDQGKQANQYLKERGVNDKLIRKFQLGYCPSSDIITSFLEKKGLELAELATAGLIKINQSEITMLFSNRLMFPIFNHAGYISGFGSRSLDPKSKYKYFNSPETICFKKNQLLYNLQAAQTDIIKHKHVILTEGYFDVIAFARIGVDNVAATMGTNLSTYHARNLARLKVPVYLCFDQDEAGFKANLHSAEILIKNKLSVKIICWFFNSAKDPDELINKNPNLKISNLIATAKHPLFYILDYFEQQGSLNHEKIIKIAAVSKPILAVSQDKILKELFLKKLGQMTGVSISTLQQTFGQNDGEAKPQVLKYQSIARQDESLLEAIKRHEINTSARIIWQALHNRAVAKFSTSQIQLLPWKYRVLLKNIIEIYQNYPSKEALDSKIISTKFDDQAQILIKQIMNQFYDNPIKYYPKELQGCWLKLEKYHKQKELFLLKQEKQKINPHNYLDIKRNSYQIRCLNKEIAKLKEKITINGNH